MSTRKIVTGDDIRFPLQITMNGANMDFSTATAVKVNLVSKNHNTRYMASDVTLDKTWTGAAWSTGLAIIRIPGTATSGITAQGRAFLEVQITMQEDVEDLTGFLPVEIITGHVG
jgi:hypothetical protein